MLKKILYADSGADNAQDMLKTLINLPAISGSEISILRVISPTTKKEEQESIEEAEAKIEQLLEKLGIATSKVNKIVKEGDPKT
ncbi:MAG: universal stress protein, partial [Xenococcaceae cyanobacterium]